jgi:hypothetical protein
LLAGHELEKKRPCRTNGIVMPCEMAYKQDGEEVFPSAGHFRSMR